MKVIESHITMSSRLLTLANYTRCAAKNIGHRLLFSEKF